MRQIINTGFVLFIILGITFLPVQATQRTQFEQLISEAENSCLPVDLVFVVDQSSDMSKFDPNGMRIKAIQWMINFLGYDRLLQCPDTVHRVGVVSFSGDITDNEVKHIYSVDMDLTSIAPNYSGESSWIEWNAKAGELAQTINVQNNFDRNFYSLSDALEEATNLLSESANVGGVAREQAVVLIIGGDGAPCTVTQSCPLYAIPRYFEALNEQFKQDLGTDLRLWVLTYGNGSDPYEFQPFWDRITQLYHGGLYSLGNGDARTAQALMQIFLEMSSRGDVKEVCGTTYVDPMVDKIAFNILSTQAIPPIAFTVDMAGLPKNLLTDTLQSAIDPIEVLYSNQNLQNPQSNMTYLFGQPASGRWQFDLNCDSNRAIAYVQYDRVVDLELLSPKEVLPQFKEPEQLFDINDPYYLKVQVIGDTGNNLPENSLYPSEINGEVILPGQSSYPLTLKSENEYFISNEPLPTSIEGEYKWVVNLKVQSADPQLNGEYVYSIQKRGVYEVASRIPFSMQIESPSSSKPVPLHGNVLNYFLKVRPFDVQVRLKLNDENNTQTELVSALSGDQEQSIKVVLYHLSSDTQQEVWLVPDPTNPLLYVGKVGDQIDAEGDYALKVDFEGTYDEEHFRLAKNESGERVEFVRKDGLLETPLFYYILFSTVLLTLLTIALYQTWIRTNPVEGYFLFKAPIDGMRPFAILDLTEKGRLRKVVFTRPDLVEKSHMLSDLESIEVKNTALFGGETTQIILEDQNSNPVSEVKFEKNDLHEQPLGKAKSAYQIVYVRELPSGTAGDVNN